MTETLKVPLRDFIINEDEDDEDQNIIIQLMTLIVEKSTVYTPNGIVEFYGYGCSELKHVSNYYQCRIVFKLYDDIVNDQNMCFGEIMYDRTDPDFLWKYGDFHERYDYNPNDIEEEKECLTVEFDTWFIETLSSFRIMNNYDIKICISPNCEPVIQMNYDHSQRISFDDLKMFIDVVEHLANEGRITCNLSIHQ